MNLWLFVNDIKAYNIYLTVSIQIQILNARNTMSCGDQTSGVSSIKQ